MKRLMDLRHFLRLLTWATAIHSIVYVAYIIDIYFLRGADSWFELIVFQTYGKLGALILIRVVHDSIDSVGAILVFAPAIGMALSSVIIAFIFPLLFKLRV